MLAWSVIPGRGVTPSEATTTCSMVSASSAAANSQSHAPSTNRGRTSAAAWKRESGLADTTGSRQGHEPGHAERLRDRLEIVCRDPRTT